MGQPQRHAAHGGPADRQYRGLRPRRAAESGRLTGTARIQSARMTSAKSQRTVFFVSDRTGITAELLGKTLLTQFPGIEFRKRSYPFVDTVEKAQTTLAQIDATARS